MLMKQGSPARLHYMANSFRVLSAGDHVLCAQSGVPIALEHLRYWNVERQEPYASPDLATRAALQGS